MKLVKEFGKVVGTLALLTVAVGGYMGVKTVTENAKGCVVDNPMALNPMAELFAIGENAERIFTGSHKCSWGFKPK